MRVYGYEISDALAERMFARMGAEFRARDLVRAFQFQDVPNPSAYRAADRIIQKRRKAGEIRWVAERKVWERV